jgi:hypothetical protein
LPVTGGFALSNWLQQKAVHNTMSKTSQTQAADKEAQRDTTNNNADTTPSDTVSPAEGIEDFASMEARQTAFNVYMVVNHRTGGMYRVDLADPSCTCEDMEYNRDDGEACKHIRKAHHQAPAHKTAEEIRLLETGDMLDEMRSLVEDVRQHRTALEADAKAAEGTQTTADTPETDADDAPDVDPVGAAVDLEEAFEGFVPDMQVEATDNYVWLKTGYDTPDELETQGPGPAIDPFETFVQDPETPAYVPGEANPGQLPDGYRNAPDERPGEYHKTALLPNDVSEYLSEVGLDVSDE